MKHETKVAVDLVREARKADDDWYAVQGYSSAYGKGQIADRRRQEAAAQLAKLNDTERFVVECECGDISWVC